MKRRSFLKILGVAPVALAIPKIAATEEFKSVGFKISVDKSKSDGANIVGKINFINEPFTNELSGLHEIPQRPFTIVAKDKFSEPMLEAWANITGVCRMPLETDKQLRARILNKLERNNV